MESSKSKEIRGQRGGAQRASLGESDFERSKVHGAIEGGAYRAVGNVFGRMGGTYGSEATTDVGWNKSELGDECPKDVRRHGFGIGDLHVAFIDSSDAKSGGANSLGRKLSGDSRMGNSLDILGSAKSKDVEELGSTLQAPGWVLAGRCLAGTVARLGSRPDRSGNQAKLDKHHHEARLD
ncbi:unnamed protein product [Ilex paraguariensis]|uniref:Uncharacterized protein n=1 Tax=Ilex paraguariensis TaxID=185542 RepID=A0ABC8S3A7_9AQUA